ncbi:MAG: SlyX family protein [Bdellovibrio sp.]|nr:SlyX family protein [Bdellovibrio sp.]
MTDENRLIAIETKISHQEFTIDELNEVIYQQQQQIDLLEKKLSSIIKRVEGAMNSGNEIGPPGEKPPHY